MEGLKLGEIEQAYYAELFQTCDVEGTGKITGLKASELFLASSLPQDVLKQIWEMCGAKRLGHFGRSQFYIALKLIAVAQNNLPLKLDTLNAGIDIPLPKFSSKSTEQGISGEKKRGGGADGEGAVGDGKSWGSGAMPPSPVSKQSHRRRLSGQYRGVVPDGSEMSVHIYSEVKSWGSGAMPPPPVSKQSHRRSLSGQYRGVVPDS
ncbi:hypothetical protein ACOMHN_043191 [Nucella lapillus]